ncbi:MAG: hypothetical protein ACI8WT_003669 [Clostridium sp.]|jgi:hypothetical protein
MKYDDFEELIYADLSWRKKEISELFLLTSDKKNDVLFKSIILVLYAHWEGYIKRTSKLYILYISKKKINICDLTINFKAISLKTDISSTIDGKEKLNLSKELEFMIKYRNLHTKRFKVAISMEDEFDADIINTHHNLSSKVFKNILNIMGIKYVDAFRSREKYIDSSLLGNRNAIGHGNKFDKNKHDDFDLCIDNISELKAFIIQILDFYTNMLLDYIGQEFYLEGKDSEKNIYDKEKNTEFEKILARIEEEHTEKQPQIITA